RHPRGAGGRADAVQRFDQAHPEGAARLLQARRNGERRRQRAERRRSEAVRGCQRQERRQFQSDRLDEDTQGEVRLQSPAAEESDLPLRRAAANIDTLRGPAGHVLLVDRQQCDQRRGQGRTPTQEALEPPGGALSGGLARFNVEWPWWTYWRSSTASASVRAFSGTSSGNAGTASTSGASPGKRPCRSRSIPTAPYSSSAARCPRTRTTGTPGCARRTSSSSGC